MTGRAGVLRTATSLDEAAAVVADVERRLGPPGTAAAWELANLCEVGRALVAAAAFRAESRGAHTRTDFPDRDDARFRTRLIHR